jgi:hypothetical protein
MTADPERREDQPQDEQARDPEQGRRRRAEVFGDVLPEGTRDERDDGWSEREPREATEEWLRRQVPPHHG